MTTDRPTPITDAAALGFARLLIDRDKSTTTELVDANFARRLERERAELRQMLREAYGCCSPCAVPNPQWYIELTAKVRALLDRTK